MTDAVLILENGLVFRGHSFGAEGVAMGEVVFTTGMTGYIETLTDPSFFGQIVTQTFPLIGNYGFIPPDTESCRPFLKAYITRYPCPTPSNFRCETTLQEYLLAQKIIGLCNIDTRALTKVLREKGVMNGVIASGASSDAAAIFATLQDNASFGELLAKLRAFKVIDAVKTVSAITSTTATIQPAKGDAAKTIVLWDFGAKENIARSLVACGFKVKSVASGVLASDIFACNPAGVLLSNGPGDPADNPAIIAEIAKLMASDIPIFGICLGHQLMALAAGAKTIKLKYGHRGSNHPVMDTATKKVYITSQNHGFAVDTATIPSCANASFVNLNDDTCEGIKYIDKPFFSVQFHPEASAGPKDTGFLFKEFASLVAGQGD